MPVWAVCARLSPKTKMVHRERLPSDVHPRPTWVLKYRALAAALSAARRATQQVA
jgi:hypothetical protein